MKRLLPCQILASITRGQNIKNSYNNNKLKISAPTWNDKFELQDYFEYILKRHG